MLLATTLAHPPNVEMRSLHPIGIVRNKGKQGTGFLIGKCEALTARHVLSVPKVGKRVRFSLPQSKLSTGATVIETSEIDGGGISGDWANLRLDECLGEKVGFLEVGSPNRHGSSWMAEWGSAAIAGYPYFQAPSNGPAIDAGCTVIDEDPDRLQSNCAVYPGNSGGPLLQWQSVNGEWSLFAVGIISTGSGGARYSEAVPIPVKLTNRRYSLRQSIAAELR